MREIVLDTETTGTDPAGDRIVEICCVELLNYIPTGRTFHVFINAQGRPVHADALSVHGISDADLVDKPTFPQVADEFIAFIDGARLVAHNAGFDMGFINAEFARLGLPPVVLERVTDTLALARRKHPMGPNSLDALCKRYGIDNSRRTKHGALLDSELLAEVYIELIGGKQAALVLDTASDEAEEVTAFAVDIAVRQRPYPLASRFTEAEREAHARLVAALGEKAIWLETTGAMQPAEAIAS